MTLFPCSIKQNCFILLLFYCISLGSASALAENGFVVKPVEEVDQVRLLSSQTWPAGSGQEELMFKLAYVRGLLDAWQLAALAPKASNAVLHDLEGKNLSSLVNEIDAYYRADPQNYLMPPASVLLRVLPAHVQKRIDNND